MHFQLLKVFTLLLAITLTFSRASAAEFEIYQSGYKPLQVAVVMLAAHPLAKEKDFAAGVIRNDLAGSQSFKAMDPLSFIASADATWKKVDYADWRIIGTDTLAVCRLTRTEKGWRAEVRVYDPFRSKQLSSTSFEASDLRYLAHSVADHVYQTVLGIPGYFHSHILFVDKKGNFSDLIYMDQDGANRQVVGRNFSLLLSPDWSPDGQLVALNTYVGNHPRLEFFNLRNGSRTVFGEFKGLNSTPEFSPDGRYVAATLSYAGSSNIHIYDIQTGRWRQLTHDPHIETTPTWSPDGKRIAYVSNRTGGPQVYVQDINGGKPVRISHDGPYNTSPVWSPTGDRIALITKKDWDYALATIKPDGSDIRYLVTGQRVESPSWSPNGQMLLYSANDGGKRRVFRIPAWGGKAEPISPPGMDASDPAWSRH